jgi:hypothetical protein
LERLAVGQLHDQIKVVNHVLAAVSQNGSQSERSISRANVFDYEPNLRGVAALKGEGQVAAAILCETRG